MLLLSGVWDKVRGDGDNHMRGIGCLLTGVELYPGNIQGGSTRRPAGPAGGRSTRRSAPSCKPTPPRAPASVARIRRDGPRAGRHLEPDDLRRAEQAGHADRRSVPDVRQALRPDERSRVLGSVLDDVQDDLKKVARGQPRRSSFARRACHVLREMEQELRSNQNGRQQRRSATWCPKSIRA